MKTAKKLLGILLSICLICSALTVGFVMPASADAALPVFEGNYVAATDFSVLTPSREAYVQNKTWQCDLDTTTEIFTDGILIDTGDFTIGADKSNFHGFYATDTDGDGGTDYIQAYPYNNQGLRFTLGFNAAPNVSGGEAIAVRIENAFTDTTNSYPQWWQKWVLTLNDSEGNSYATSANSYGDAYFVETSTGTKSIADAANGIVYAVGYYTDRWMIIPMTYFGEDIDTADITSISFNVGSASNKNNFNIYEIGIVTDLNGFLGIVEPIEESEYVTLATDFSGLTPSREAYIQNKTWQCDLDTTTEIFTDGILVDTGDFGTGKDKSNFHGFYTYDTDADGGTDYLEAFPYDNKGMRFTLNMNTEPDVDGEAIAIQVCSNYSRNDLDSWPQYWQLTLNDYYSESYAMSVGNAAASLDSNIYIVDSASGEVTTFDYVGKQSLTMTGKYAKSWIIIPLSHFGADIKTSEIESIKFDIGAAFNSCLTQIHDVAYVTDMYALLDMERPEPPLDLSGYLSKMNDFSALANGWNNNYIATTWDGLIPDDNLIISSGILINDGNFGLGAGSDDVCKAKSNIHGFHVLDNDGDSAVDTLYAYAHCNGGVRFTLGMLGEKAADGDAIAIDFRYIDNGAWTEETIFDVKITLNDVYGNSYTFDYDGGKGLANYFVTDDGVLVRNTDDNGAHVVRACTNGTLVLPMAGFSSELNTADIDSISFDMSSTWNYEIGIGDINVVTGMNDYLGDLGRTAGDLDWDGVVNATDIANVCKILVNASRDANLDNWAADMNADGALDVLDVIKLKKDLAE